VFAYRATYPLRQIVATARDIINTGHLDARVAKPSGNDELTDLVNLFNSMLEKNQDLIRAMRESLDNTAHDLRTPLTRLRITAETGLQTEASRDQSREALADCVEESERVLKILNTLLDVTEAEAGMMQLHLEPLQMSQLLGEVIEIYEFVADEKQIDVRAELDPNCVVRGDPQRLRQVFANLLDNALKYTSSGGQVIVRATCEPGGAVVRIRDTGQGIDLDEQPKIWTRLYRGDKSRSQRGLGLGLSLVKAIVEAHQGRVSVESTPGEGSEFVVQFPGADNEN
jgi:signal transduction histidine kinase